jgi:hypothetical protein
MSITCNLTGIELRTGCYNYYYAAFTALEGPLPP